MAEDSDATKRLWEADELVRRADVYDLAVGVVSGFQFLFTQQPGLSPSVVHFERYPKVVHEDGNEATPDFTVLFDDGAALIGEIAHLPRADQGVDALCRQLMRYDQLNLVPAGPTTTAEPALVDQLVLVKHGTGTAAVKRIIRDRLEDPEHWFKVSIPPCIVSVAPTDAGYTFERQGAESNGVIRDGAREGIGGWLLEGDINLAAKYFADIKAEWVFVNDEIDPLYLATHLWTREFAVLAPRGAGRGRDVPIRFRSADLAATMRQKYGRCNAADVNRAMELLQRAKFARPLGGNQWEVAWGPFQQEGDDLRRALARRAEDPPREGKIERLLKVEDIARREKEQPRTLWDALAEQEEEAARRPSRSDGVGKRSQQQAKKAKPPATSASPQAPPASKKSPAKKPATKPGTRSNTPPPSG